MPVTARGEARGSAEVTTRLPTRATCVVEEFTHDGCPPPPMCQVTMREEPRVHAAVLMAPGHVRVERHPEPRPDRSQVRLRLEGCGVCASNLPPFEGRPWFSYPFGPGAPGHEGWGIVDELGADVHELSVGDRVAALSQAAYATHDLARADEVVRLPAVLDGLPFPGEPLACAFNVFRRAQIAAGDRVAIVGVGFLGAMVVALARRAGAEVIAISRRRSSLELAEHHGAAHLIEMDEHARIVAEVHRITAGAGCDVSIEAVGTQWPLDLAGELTRVRGRLVVAGYHQDARQVNMQLWNWRGLDVVNAHERDPAVYVQGMREAVAAAASWLDLRPLLTHTYGLDELATALAMTGERPEGFVKALIAFDS